MLIFLNILAIFALLFLLFIFLCAPAARKHPDRSILKGAYIAHRGLHNIKEGVPENSLPAFKKAIEKGHAIEIDIHLTKDGEIVVFHDDDLKRVCSDPRKIEEMTLSELKELKLSDTENRIPTLKECLNLVDGKVFLLIEFKVVKGNTKKLCETADKILKSYEGKYFIQSFYPQVLNWYKKHRPDICRGQLSATFKGESLAKVLLGKQVLNFLGRPDFASFKHEDSRSPFYRFVLLLGAEPVGWTFRSKEDLWKKKEPFSAFIYENFIL